MVNIERLIAAHHQSSSPDRISSDITSCCQQRSPEKISSDIEYTVIKGKVQTYLSSYSNFSPNIHIRGKKA